MATKVYPDLAKELKKYGADDFNACYNCGNCTAVCNLTEEHENFPRMMIRYGLLGLKDEILSSRELWMCYYCGECTETCPRQADPGELMAAMRRYAIAHYEPSGLTRLIFKNNPFYIFFTLLLAVVLGFFLLTLRPEMEVSRWIFERVPYEVIHNIGLGAFIFMGLTAFWGMGRMILKLRRGESRDNNKKAGLSGALKAFGAMLTEVVTMARYRKCDAYEDEYFSQKPWVVRPWWVHWSIMWGFIGLLVATALDFIFKDPATTVWWPSRILGTLAGLFMMYGSTLALWYRITRPVKSYESTKLADWIFLIFIWLAGITGFWMEIAVFAGLESTFSHIVFLIHTVISMELVILFAYSKFAHAFYRPVALYFSNLAKMN